VTRRRWAHPAIGGPVRRSYWSGSKRNAALAERRCSRCTSGWPSALRPALLSIWCLGRGQPTGAMVAGDAPGQVETVIAWSGARRIHLITWCEIREGRRVSVEDAASRIADVDDLDHALVRVFRHRVQRRLPGQATPNVWFEVG
jgi:hypothetical protein